MDEDGATGPRALVVGASGAIGAAIAAQLRTNAGYTDVVGLSRTGSPPLDITDERSVAACAAAVDGAPGALRLIVDATGFLHGADAMPEKSWAAIDPTQMARAFCINAIGPALLMKHLLPLMPRTGRAVFATLSAKVGSIGDNRLGGWYSYRASKAALNQIVRTAAIELKRRNPDAVCVALHPGTVESALSAPSAKTSLAVRAAPEAAAQLLGVIDALTPGDSGNFFDYRGARLPW